MAICVNRVPTLAVCYLLTARSPAWYNDPGSLARSPAGLGDNEAG